MKGIADTGFLVAYLNRRDSHHLWAVDLARMVSEPLLTCQAVLAEAVFYLGSARAVFQAVETGLVRDAFDFSSHFNRLGELARSYEDRNPDMADLCLVCLSESHPRLPVITVDGDFKVYRRFGRHTIPLIMPEDG